MTGPLNFTEYQKQAQKTAGAGSSSIELRKATAALGLAGEAGELANLIKKEIAHGHTQDNFSLLGEIGDCLWYLAEICNTYQFSLDDVARHNLRKLAARYPGGFSEEDSQQRDHELAGEDDCICNGVEPLCDYCRRPRPDEPIPF